MILSFSSSSISLLTCPTARSASVSRVSCLVVSGGGAWRWNRFSCLALCDLKLRGLGQMLEGKKSFSRSGPAAANMVASSSTSDEHDISPRRTFLEARTGQDLILGIRKEAEAGRLPVTIAEGMEELYLNYRNAVLQSEHPKADEIVLSNMTVALDRVFMDVRDPFQFSPYHKAIREPFDYYMFGQDYIRPLLDFRDSWAWRIPLSPCIVRYEKAVWRGYAPEMYALLHMPGTRDEMASSFLGNIALFSEMEKKLHQGENIILISNHQTEADPAVISLLLESINPSIAENLIYIAGDRVVTDPLCKPFSMGRNLLCVYSKKHMNDDPELFDMKKRANMKSLKEMTLLLRGGSKIIWIAPSGGRDRPDPETKEWYPAPFDASSLENMRRVAEHAGVPGNIYPLAILCHDSMPPPQQVEKEIGEKRVISFHGVGVSAAPSISYHEMATAFEDPEQAKMEYARSMYSSVCEQYNVLKSAIHGKQGLNASTPHVSLSQPWQQSTREIKCFISKCMGKMVFL